MSRRSMLLAVAATAVLAVPLTAIVTADAVSAPSPQLHACATAKGTLSLLSSAGKCAKGSHAVTINQQGPKGATGARGPQGVQGRQGSTGKPGITTALAKSVAGPVPIAMAGYGQHGTYPAYTTLLQTKNVPAGSYLVAGSVDIRNTSTDNPGIDIVCSVGRPLGTTQPGDKFAVGSWSDTDAGPAPVHSSVGGTQASGSITGALTLAFPTDVQLLCLNWQSTSADTVAYDVNLVLTPISALHETTG